MVSDLLMAAITTADGETESEGVLVILEDDGRLRLKLDDGTRIELDYDELLALAADEPCAAAAHEEAA